jgi:signal transduction histidine kinase
MRERAESFGAKLEVWSERGAGTEIELSVPERLAYDGAMKVRSLFGFLARRRHS